LSAKSPSISSIGQKIPTGLSLRANFVWTFLGNGWYSGTQWGLLILLTKLFEPALFGRYALALSIVTPLFITSALYLRAVLISTVEDQSKFADYLLLRLVTNTLALILLTSLGFLGIISSEIFVLTLLIGSNQALMLISDVFQGLMQKHERMDLVAISNILQGSVSLIAATTMAFVTHDIVFVVLGMCVARLCVLLGYDLRRVRLSFVATEGLIGQIVLACRQPTRLLSLARTAFPLGIVALLLSLNSNIPRYFLAPFGEAAVGYYAAIASLMVFQELIIGALGQSSVRRLALYYATDRKAFVRLIGRLLAIGAILGLAGIAIAILFGRQVLLIFFREEYGGFVDVFVWLMVARLVLNAQSFMGFSMTAAHKYRAQVWVNGAMVAVLSVSAWALIPTWAGRGAAWALLLAACAALGASIAVMAKEVRSGRSADNG
jgi:O-antigen/teichoic acid export membrane protein